MVMNELTRPVTDNDTEVLGTNCSINNCKLSRDLAPVLLPFYLLGIFNIICQRMVIRCNAHKMEVQPVNFYNPNLSFLLFFRIVLTVNEEGKNCVYGIIN